MMLLSSCDFACMCLARGQAHHQLPREVLMMADTASVIMGTGDLQPGCGTPTRPLQPIWDSCLMSIIDCHAVILKYSMAGPEQVAIQKLDMML